jgi:hypothetical protein
MATSSALAKSLVFIVLKGNNCGMGPDVMLAVHGYSPEGMESGREPEEVWSDRLRKADQVLEKLAGMGCDPVVVFSGGGEFDGISEAQHIKRHASKNFCSIVNNHKVV